MVNIKKIKIKKTTYSFDINRLYNYEKTYKVIEKNPIETIIAELTKKGKKKQKSKEDKEVKKKGLDPLLVAGAISAILLIVLGIWIMITIGAVPPEEPPIEKTYLMDFKVQYGEVITYGEKGENLHSGSAIIEQRIEGYENVSLVITTYDEAPPYQVYILDEPRDISQTKEYLEFKSSLSLILKSRGIILNTVTLNDLKTIPKGALVIIPSGRIPTEMLENGENNLKEMLNRGVHILYIGKEFTHSVNSYGGIEVTNSSQLEGLKITFENLESSYLSELDIIQPQYSAVGDSEEYLNFRIYGIVSVLKHNRNNGYLIMVPQTLDAGWDKMSQAAEVVSKIVLENRWIEPTSHKTYNLETKNETMLKTYYSKPFENEKAYIRMDLIGNKGNEIFGKILYITAIKELKGELYITDGTTLLPSSISGKEIRTKLDLKETDGKTIYPYISISENGIELKREALSTVKISTNTDSDYPVWLDIKGGEHTAYVVDENGKKYAAGYVNSVGIEIIKVSSEDYVFIYSFRVNDNPVTLSEIKVSVDDGKLGEYTFTQTSEVTIDLKPKLGIGGKLEPGSYSFKFIIGDLEEENIHVVYGDPDNIFTSPFFFGTLIVVALVLGVGGYMAKQKKPKYYIDIPDFPPTEYKKVAVPKELILGIFEKENEYHKWKNTPLTLAEIKSGLRKTFYKGGHIITSDFNLSYVLDKLKKIKLVDEEIGYYLPSSWKKEGTSRYLATYRKIRDICVVNAVPFSKKGEIKNCTSKLRVIGQEIYVHAYEKQKINEVLEDLIKTINKGINIVLVKNDYEKNQFKEFLTSPTHAATILKLENEAKTISVMNMGEFEKMIKEMKA